MSIKLYEIEPKEFIFICPGCNCLHSANTDPKHTPVWSFNGDFEKPTFSPSINYPDGRDGKGNKTVCHFFIKSGMIEFCPDSTHELAGQIVELPDWNDA